MVKSFQIARTPFLVFGKGCRRKLPSFASRFGQKILLVTGAESLRKSGILEEIERNLGQEGIRYKHLTITDEPSPGIIDQYVRDSISFQPAAIVAIGGGSVLDAGKAISAMLPLGEPVKDYLEGVGTKAHPGNKIPLIAMPTTAGTGSEATKNAVLSEVGEKGFKKSLRHDNFVADFALLDPELTYYCPPSVTAASGMDCLTQLMESYLSLSANPFTDALALPAIRDVLHFLPEVYANPLNEEGRGALLYAAYISGITLANAGLGTVHGVASALGGLAPLPHGTLCGSIMAEINKITMQKLLESQPDSVGMLKYRNLAASIIGKGCTGKECVIILSDFLDKLVYNLNLPRLRVFNVSEKLLAYAAEITENKNNPVALTKEEILQALLNRL